MGMAMNETIWTPQFTTAAWGFGGVVIGSLISWAVQSFLLGRRIVADERLTERKFKFDMELAERKF